MTADIDLSFAMDERIVDIALKNNDVIITHDLDFGRILAFSNHSHPSVIIFRSGDMSVE